MKTVKRYRVGAYNAGSLVSVRRWFFFWENLHCGTEVSGNILKPPQVPHHWDRRKTERWWCFESVRGVGLGAGGWGWYGSEGAGG